MNGTERLFRAYYNIQEEMESMTDGELRIRLFLFSVGMDKAMECMGISLDDYFEWLDDGTDKSQYRCPLEETLLGNTKMGS